MGSDQGTELPDAESLDRLTAEQVVERWRTCSADDQRRCLDELYRRFYQQVLLWCRRVCNSQEEATDVAQEVFLRVHTRLDSFRGASKFSTWLYTVTRRVAINRMKAERKRSMHSIERPDGSTAEVVDPTPSPESLAETAEISQKLQSAIAEELTPDEASVLYLHFVDGLTLPNITDLLGFENKSGAKAYLVSAKRKLHRTFGCWLAAQKSPPKRGIG